MKKAQIISIFGLIILFQFSLRAESNIIINEIHYDVSDKTLRAEFIELHNTSDKLVDISGWRISSAVNYTFPQNTILESGGFLVIAEDPKIIFDKWGINALGSWVGNLANDGETVRLRNSSGDLVNEVDYQSITMPLIVFYDENDILVNDGKLRNNYEKWGGLKELHKIEASKSDPTRHMFPSSYINPHLDEEFVLKIKSWVKKNL